MYNLYKEIIKEILREELVDPICTIPLSGMSLEVKLIWKANANGKVTIRSAYYLEVTGKKWEVGESSRNLHKTKVWKRIWNLEVANSIRTVLWKVVKNILPIRLTSSKEWYFRLQLSNLWKQRGYNMPCAMKLCRCL